MSDGRPLALGLAVAVEPTGRAARLWRVLVELATRPAKPRPGARVVPGRSENLVLEFDEAYTAFVEGFERLPSEGQMVALQRVDARLSAMVRAQDAELWTERARREDAVWGEVRGLAGEVIREFGWPAGVGSGSVEGRGGVGR